MYEFIDQIPSDNFYIFDAGACHNNILKKYDDFYKLDGNVDELHKGYNSRKLITNVHTFERSLTYDKKTNSLIVERLKSNDFLNEINGFSKSSNVYPIIEMIKLLNSTKIFDLTNDSGFVLIASFLTNKQYTRLHNNDKMFDLFKFLQVNTNKFTVSNDTNDIESYDTIFIDENTDIKNMLSKLKLGTYVISNNSIDLTQYNDSIAKIRNIESDVKFHIWKYGIPAWIENMKITDVEKLEIKLHWIKR